MMFCLQFETIVHNSKSVITGISNLYMPTLPSYREKQESELFEHVRKATNDLECAPKQKHVRWCIVYCWDHGISRPFWQALRSQPLAINQIQCFKALIVIHKVLLDGPKFVLQDALREAAFISQLSNRRNYSGNASYGTLAQCYVQYLKIKLEFHRIHPKFNGKFDYTEYIAQHDSTKLDDRFETINELLDLLSKLDQLQRSIIRQSRGIASNECLQSALIPLVEESEGMYKFSTTMLTGMFGIVASTDPLILLKDKFNDLFYKLKQFYEDCRHMNYLTSIIAVPELPSRSPFEDSESSNTSIVVHKPESPPTPPRTSSDPIIDFTSGGDMNNNNNNWLISQSSYSTSTAMASMAPNDNINNMMYYQQQQQQQSLAISAINEELSYYKNNYEQSQQMVSQYQQQISMLESNMSMMNMNAQHDNSMMIQQLQAEIQHWKSKYETMARLYQDLRSEHLELLRKYDDANQQLKILANAADGLKRSQQETKDQAIQINKLLRENSDLQNSFDKLTANHQEELQRLKRDNADMNAQLKELAQTKGSEVQAIMDKLIKEKQESDELYKAQIDQALEALSALQKTLSEKEDQFRDQLAREKQQYSNQIEEFLDQMLMNCNDRLLQALRDYDNPSISGNTFATAPITLSMLEKANHSVSDFKTILTLFVTSQQQSIVDVIQNANDLTGTLEQIFEHVKMLAIASAQGNKNDLHTKIHAIGKDGSRLFQEVQLKSGLGLIRESDRSNYIQDRCGSLLSSLSNLSNLLEQHVTTEKSDTLQDGGDAVSREFSAAAARVQEATSLLHSLLSSNKNNENEPILTSSLAITDAIGLLIKYATQCQQEIVAHGRGSGSPESFYKQNSRWTEGLISAAREVANSVSILSETSDGLIKGDGKFKIEQLIVAGRQVSAATAQLVAASRVKSVPHSKIQYLLEDAAKAVMKATQTLMDVANQKNENAQRIISKDQGIDSEQIPASFQQYTKEEMERQVKIVTLEKQLEKERIDLAQFRRHAYKFDNLEKD